MLKRLRKYHQRRRIITRFLKVSFTVKSLNHQQSQQLLRFRKFYKNLWRSYNSWCTRMLTRKSFSTNFAPRSKNHGSHCCLTRQPLCFACAVQLPTFCLHCILIHRQRANRNGETVKHFHNCIKVLSQFRIHTVQICGSIARGRSGAHDNAQIPNLQFSLPTSAPENCIGL